ncbi:hypothetical protein SAMN04489737_0515 [Arcanobacterium phocae]|uniref:Uncharacterized protein n=1 Tax=Arcanobacterium phocae TaxID=131112 RepID=A0A1H2LC16_9ACTO|nr:hypothetical protein [Arcanobacterium phocae]SDU78543.1 hypothetical protein SAMN04489737_0515 [Arcanobacterium phocae]
MVWIVACTTPLIFYLLFRYTQPHWALIIFGVSLLGSTPVIAIFNIPLEPKVWMIYNALVVVIFSAIAQPRPQVWFSRALKDYSPTTSASYLAFMKAVLPSLLLVGTLGLGYSLLIPLYFHVHLDTLFLIIFSAALIGLTSAYTGGYKFYFLTASLLVPLLVFDKPLHQICLATSIWMYAYIAACLMRDPGIVSPSSTTKKPSASW